MGVFEIAAFIMLLNFKKYILNILYVEMCLQILSEIYYDIISYVQLIQKCL